MIKGNNAVLDLLDSESVKFLIDEYKNHETLRLYKHDKDYDSHYKSLERTFDPETDFKEFRGIFWSIEADELVDINFSGLQGIKSLHQIYTYENLDFEIYDFVTEGNDFNQIYQIMKVDSSFKVNGVVSYYTLILKGSLNGLELSSDT